MVRRRIEDAPATIGMLERHGPLGAENMRRQLGRSVRLTATSVVASRKKMTLIQAAASRAEGGGPSLGEALAQSMIVTCTYRLDPTTAQAAASPGNLKARVLGHIVWGNDGHSEELTFDWAQGTTIRVCGSFVRVTAQLVNGVDGSVPTASVVVGAFVGYGQQSVRRATLTQLVTTSALPGTSVPIPSRAKGVAFWCPSNLIVRQFWGTTNLGAGGTFPTGSSGTTLLLPAGLTQLSLEAAVNPTNVLVVWELDT